MFRNLDAERARLGETTAQVASLLGISRTSFEKKTKSGKFTVLEVNLLLRHYAAEYSYLFEPHNDQSA